MVKTSEGMIENFLVDVSFCPGLKKKLKQESLDLVEEVWKDLFHEGKKYNIFKDEYNIW